MCSALSNVVVETCVDCWAAERTPVGVEAPEKVGWRWLGVDMVWGDQRLLQRPPLELLKNHPAGRMFAEKLVVVYCSQIPSGFKMFVGKGFNFLAFAGTLSTVLIGMEMMHGI